MNNQSQHLRAILSIDYGSRYVGLAIASSDIKIARPLETLVDLDEAELLDRLDIIIKDYRVDLILVGDPLSLSGAKSEQSKISDQFRLSLSQFLGGNIPVILQAETDSSNQAEEMLGNNSYNKQQGKIDSMAATIFLQDYLDQCGFSYSD